MTPKKEKPDSTVIVAIIGLAGTLIAGLLSSPVILKLLDQTPTPAQASPSATTAPQPVSPTNTAVPIPGNLTATFSQAFDSNPSGFAFDTPLAWEIVKYKGNPVLEVDASQAPANDGSDIIFGPPDFGNGVINFKFNLIETGNFFLGFRGNQNDSYLVYFAPQDSAITIMINGQTYNWNGEDLSTRSFTFTPDNWYDVRLEVQGENMTLWIDNNRILTASDARLQSGAVFFHLDAGSMLQFDDVQIWQPSQ
jgi:hypothetical protein